MSHHSPPLLTRAHTHTPTPPSPLILHTIIPPPSLFSLQPEVWQEPLGNWHTLDLITQNVCVWMGMGHLTDKWLSLEHCLFPHPPWRSGCVLFLFKLLQFFWSLFIFGEFWHPATPLFPFHTLIIDKKQQQQYLTSAGRVSLYIFISYFFSLSVPYIMLTL